MPARTLSPAQTKAPDGAAIIQMLKLTANKTFDEYAQQVFIPYAPSQLHSVSCSQFSGYLLQAAQYWANAGVTEDGHCQDACRPQWFFYVLN